MAVLRIDSLPDSALDASAAFLSEWLPKARELLTGAEDTLAIIVPPAPYNHDDWRRAAIRDLARECAPMRAVMIAGPDEGGGEGAGEGEGAVDATLAYLGRAPGVTGQYLKLD